jgi:uncharacterized protein YlbG (UPF0298 family)
MDCFKDYIGINACGNETSVSGLFINQLPGVTFKMITGIIENDQDTFVKLWKDIQERALRKFGKDYHSKFTKKYVGFCCDSADCDPEKICCDNIEIFADAWLYCLGVELMIERLYSTRLNRFTTIDKDQASELRDYYMVEYEKNLNYAIKYLPKAIIENCFECRSSIDYVERLP